MDTMRVMTPTRTTYYSTRWRHWEYWGPDDTVLSQAHTIPIMWFSLSTMGSDSVSCLFAVRILAASGADVSLNKANSVNRTLFSFLTSDVGWWYFYFVASIWVSLGWQRRPLLRCSSQWCGYLLGRWLLIRLPWVDWHAWNNGTNMDRSVLLYCLSSPRSAWWENFFRM